MTDDFEDEDLTQNPEWTGDVANFTTVDENGNKLLRLDASEAGTSILTTTSTTAQGTWDLFYRFDQSPSGSNKTRIFFIADTDDLNENVNGYAISIGESGDDPFRLMRYDNGSETEILTSTTEVAAGQGYQIRVTRNSSNEWSLLIGEGLGSTPMAEGGTVVDATHQTSRYFGFLLDYTSTRVDQFFFDNVIIENSKSFDAVNATVASATEVDITFNYHIDEISLDPSDFSVDGENPISVNLEDEFTVRLTFSDVFSDDDYTVTINDVDNIYGGTISADTEVNFTVSNPFNVVSVNAVSSGRIAVEFTEQPDESSWSTSDFEITEDGSSSGTTNPVSIDYDDSSEPDIIYLVLDSSLAIGDYNLAIHNVISTNGWPLAGDTEFDFSVINPFFVTNFEYLNRNEFDIIFSQDVDGSSLNTSVFEITGFGSPDDAQLEESDRVRITYNSSVDTGNRELIINGLMSESDWEIEENTTIEFTLYDEFEAGDLVISEFYYRVPISWRTSEYDRPQYVEIYNRADKLLNLRNFTINGENISIDKDLPISSGEYLVVTRGVPVFEDQFGQRNFVEADEFPEFVLTTSDDIILETDEGQEIESLTYDASEWGGNEVSLERFSFDVAANIQDNWAESEDVLTGSPGLPNTITEPANPPKAVEATFPAPQKLRITFSRTLSDDAIDNLNNFSLDNGAVITNAEFSSNPRTLEFDLNEVLEDYFEYTFNYQNVEDIFGNQVSGTQEFNFTFVNPFRILTAEMENETDLLVQFTLPLQVSTVDLSDFELDDGTDPTSFEFVNSETVRLNFGSNFSTGRYEIVVNELESLTNGWQIEENSTSEFFRFDEYQEGDIIINEFMYNPPNGYPQYVELYNRSDRFLSLKDFELLRAEGSTKIGGVITEFDEPLGPGGYLVITDDSALLKEVFGSGPWFEMSGFPGFTQTVSDQIRLFDPDGDPVEIIEYDPSTWGGSDIALERRSIDAPANDLNNWGESLDELLGTPGEENTVTPGDGPALVSATFVDAETVQVTFTGSLDTGAISTSNFDINRGLSIVGVSFINSTQAELSLDEEMSSGQTYTITVTDIPDIFGNELEENQISFTYYFVETSEPGDVVINEFMYDEPDGYTEYVELYNVSDKVFNLAGWQQANDTGTRRILTEDQIYFQPGTYMVILPNEELLSIFPDMDFVNAGSSLPALKNSGDEIVITNAAGVTLDSLRYSSQWGGTDVALERRRANRSSLYMENWADSPSEMLGTPGMPNEVERDFNFTTTEVQSLSPTQVRVVFNAMVRNSDIQTANFSVDGTNPQSISEETDKILILNFSEDLESGEQTLAIDGVRSAGGFSIGENAEFTFTVFDAFSDGDIVINEFMYNPANGYPQYVELYNRSDSFLSLKDFELLRAEGSTNIGGVITEFDEPIKPGGYLVITEDSALLEEVFGSGPWFEMDGFPGFTQTVTDQIRLLDPDGDPVEIIEYDPSTWGGSDISLERRSIDAPANDLNNWGESLDEDLGTPGEDNTVSPGDDPTLVSATFVDAETVLVTFTGSLDTGVISIGNFEINRNRSITGVNFINSTQAELLLDGKMSSGQTYTITVTNIPDIFGNELDEASVSFTYYFIETASPGDIVINEFMYDEPVGYTEYVELYNVSDKVFSLAGWQQANDTGTRRVLTQEQIYFLPGSYVVILPNEELLTIFPDMEFVNAGSSLPSLKNSGDEIVITNAAGVTLDSLRYSSQWGGSDVSLERLDPNAISSDINNWGESLSVLKGTPGEKNSVEVDTDGPELLGANFINEESIRVLFTGALDRSRITRNNFQINHGMSFRDVTFTNNTEAVLFLNQSLSSGQTYTVTVKNIPDIFGNELEEDQVSFTYYFIETAAPGDVVINEIMYDEPENYTEYIELYNVSDKAIDLAGWQNTNDTSVRRTLTTEQLIIPPNSYIAILPNFNLLNIFPDIPFLNAKTGLSTLKNGGDNIVIANAEGVIIDSLRYSPEWGGTDVALERRRPNRSSLYMENWADSPSEMSGTPGMPNEVERDFNFTVTEVQSLSPTQVRVSFNAMIRNDDIKKANFSVDGTNPQSISEETNKILILNFSEDLESGEQTLAIDEVRSAGGFSIGEHAEFSFIVFDAFSNGDIVINEFMYRPPSGYVRYVELLNTSSKLLNLKNWRLQRRDVSSDSKRIISAEDLAIQPGEYIVLSENSEALTEIFGERNFFELSSFPSLTITVADQIRLFTNEDFLADSLQYKPSEWGGNGVALERLSQVVDATFAENWSESPNELLGTPGLPNEAETDSTPPEIVQASQFEDQGFILTFDERLNSKEAMDASNYSISPKLPIPMIALDHNEVFLFVGDDLVNDQEYEITISGISDIFGNEMDPTTVSVLYLEFGEAAPGKIVINEIMVEPSDGSGAEFIEIFNRTDENFDLTDWILADAADGAEIPTGALIRENDFLVFTDSKEFASESNKFVYLPDFQSLNNSGDAVILKNATGIIIDSLYYRAAWGIDESGVSLERRDPAGLSTDPGNWASNTSERGSTPGQQNSEFEIDESAPEIIFANFIHPDSIEVWFNEYVDLTPDDNSEAEQFAKFQSSQKVQANVDFMLNGSPVDVLWYDQTSGNRIILDGSFVLQGEEIMLSVENLGDYKGNLSSKLEQPIAQPIAEGDIIFNEIMFDPISDDRDGLPDQSQYIEIHNRRSYAISLEGFFLHDEPDENGNISTIEPIRSSRQWLPANGYALIYPEPDDVLFSNSRTADFFDLPDDIQRFAIQANRTTLSLTNTGRQIYLADSTLQTIDMVDYSPDWHNPNLVDTKGIALERINPNFDTNDEANWGSNATPLGGSPGSENSIYQGSEQSISGNGISFSPNPFSPDDDGFEDNLLISYNFDAPDYLIKVRIYDRYGRLVRKLAESKRAGFDGSLVWDGRTDDGLRNRVGIYIVLMEAYNSASGKNLAFKETVVIARKF